MRLKRMNIKYSILPGLKPVTVNTVVTSLVLTTIADPDDIALIINRFRSPLGFAGNDHWMSIDVSILLVHVTLPGG